MRNRQVNYDQIAPTYDRRFDHDEPRGTGMALLTLAQDLQVERLLEVGCGTGHWLAFLRPAIPHLFGLDLSAGMLSQTRRRNGELALVRGRADQLPFPDASFDLVTCVNAIHHFEHQRTAIAEARRLLRPGGALAIVGSDPRQHRDKWYVYDFFDGTYETDLERFPSWGMVLDWMIATGFTRVEWRLAEHIEDHKHGGAVLADPFLEKNACSQLALLSDDEYAAGLDKIRAAVAAGRTGGDTVRFPCEILLRMLVGWN
jgi:ubiquinone/menaquinone biosynthesis C-methylase UbiE